jgi:hypothetical protein
MWITCGKRAGPGKVVALQRFLDTHRKKPNNTNNYCNDDKNRNDVHKNSFIHNGF